MNIEKSTIALAGMFQAAELVRQIARQGLFDQGQFETSIQSLLKLEADSVEDVYGEIGGIKTGLQVLCGQLGAGVQREMEVMHYVLGMILLERKLMKSDDLLLNIRAGIESAQAQVEMYTINHPNVIVYLANLYSQTLGTLDFRLKVNGEKRFLENQNNADKIRALLLAGIRSTVLWRQKGGKRLQFIFSRRKILRKAQQLLERIKS
ncbi:high frequency lysogenization protein HflD [Candidatus Marithioploca araucensis]|uniref:High frequency lysogenization protein HflD homolog n=1 Tax=Candidatus Marithioploca araucensis TaxID=70273 RepID=A0ABT7VW65_9GAMM|nr:high frequency lysogenization protein HflD [Candidatus Marithioploca araucensis]